MGAESLTRVDSIRHVVAGYGLERVGMKSMGVTKAGGGEAASGLRRPARAGRPALCLAGLVALISTGTAEAVPVEVNVTRVGFPTLPAGDVIRNGAWVPVMVDVSLLKGVSFDGTLRVAQTDSDGDEAYDSVEVHLRQETGGTQRYYLYVVANAVRADPRFRVEVRGVEGETVQVASQGELTDLAAPSQQPRVLPDDDLLILSVSTGTIGRTKDLVQPPDESDLRQFRRPVHVGHLSPADIPEHWIGLEMVDYVVWDEANPDDLNERQRAALLQWVRQGGTLLIAASRTAGAFMLVDDLNAVMPAQIGDVVSVANLPQVRETMLGRPFKEEWREEDRTPWYLVKFPSPIPVAAGNARPGAEQVAFESDLHSDAPGKPGVLPADVMTRRRVGRGAVVFSTVTLRDLFSAPGGASALFAKVFYLGTQEKDQGSAALPVPLFDKVMRPISFATSGSLYLLTASLASVGYVLLATLGTWSLLGVRGWRQHSWSAFALVALGTSILSVMVIQAVRGFGDALHQLSIVDADAGESYGTASVFFGLRAAGDKRLDVWLPDDPLGALEPQATNGFLRPFAGDPDASKPATTYVDPGEYRLEPGSAVVNDVRVRATLKQFEGRWQGSLGGKLSAQLATRGGRIREDSFVVNDLGVDLRDCLLLLPTSPLENAAQARAYDTYVFDVGDLPADARPVRLYDRCYRLQPTESFGQFMMRSRLSDAQQEWRSAVTLIGLGQFTEYRYGVGDERKALMLLSTIGDLDPALSMGVLDQVMGMRTISRDRLRRLDLRMQLDGGHVGKGRPGSAVLIGYAASPGPARLFRRENERSFQVLAPDERRALTMYRIRIPFTALGGGSSADEDDDELGL